MRDVKWNRSSRKGYFGHRRKPYAARLHQANTIQLLEMLLQSVFILDLSAP